MLYLLLLSCCFRDEIGGANVNLLPTDKPADIYQVVADKTNGKLKVIVKNQDCIETLQEDEVSDAQLARWWLDFYQVVADKTNGKLELIVVSKRNSSEMTQEEDEVSDYELTNPSIPHTLGNMKSLPATGCFSIHGV